MRATSTVTATDGRPEAHPSSFGNAARDALRRVDRAVVLAFLLGSTFAVIGFGPDYVLGTSSFWSYPPTDFSSHIVGWRMFLADHWRFPIFTIGTLDEPAGINALYMDCLPVIAVVAKVLHPLAPRWTESVWQNPLGLWQAFSYGMQGVMGALIMRAQGKGSRVAMLSGAALVVAMPAFMLRFYHTALNSHFLILAALYLYLRTRDETSLGWRVTRWTLLFFVAILVHPYLFAMCGGIFAAALVTRLVAKEVRDAAVLAVVPSVTVIVTIFVSGFAGAPSLVGGAWGYGYKSTDLASFFLPQWSTFLPRYEPLAVDMARSEFAEGWDYLGVGVIALLVLVVLRPRAILAAARRHWALMAALVLMALFAISHRPTFGLRVLFELPLPKALSWFTQQFRSNGRFIWPATYAGSLYLLALAFQVCERGILVFAPPLAAAVQLVDGFGNFVFIRAYTETPAVRFLDWEKWEPVIAEHRGISFGPSFECVYWDHPFIAFDDLEIQYMAAKHGVGMSSVRSSRSLRDCTMDAALRRRAPVERDRLYVLHRAEVAGFEIAHYEAQGAPCVHFEHGIACSSRFEHAPKGFRPFEAPPNYVVGEKVSFGAGTNDEPYLGEGWSYPEAAHRWTDGDFGFVYLRGDRAVPDGATIRVRLGGLVAGTKHRTTGSVRMNGAVAGRFELDDDLAHDLEFRVPDAAVGRRVIEVVFAVDDARPLSAFGVAGENRRLGVSVVALSIASDRRLE